MEPKTYPNFNIIKEALSDILELFRPKPQVYNNRFIQRCHRSSATTDMKRLIFFSTNRLRPRRDIRLYRELIGLYLSVKYFEYVIIARHTTIITYHKQLYIAIIYRYAMHRVFLNCLSCLSLTSINSCE